MNANRRIAPAVAVALLVLAVAGHAATSKSVGAPLPEFTHSQPGAWLNSAPLATADLAGKVVLVDVWTYECWNCYRSFPWMTSLEQRFAGKPFEVIGVHSPEYERERDEKRIAAKAEEFGLTHPIMIDNDHSYWQALDNHYWPAYYLVDRGGTVRAVFVGETHAGDPQARRIEAAIERLLTEPSEPKPPSPNPAH